MPQPNRADAWHASWVKCKRLITGPARDPFAPETRHNITLAAFLAWVGLGADGLSSSSYGPEEAFKALGPHTDLALFLAIATAVTVFIIALSYNQVIELFPTGGGGYKVATRLLGRRAGLVSGSALVVDYVLTIAISIAASVDALFSFMPPGWAFMKPEARAAALLLLLLLNLRGMKESITILLPIFIGFAITHVILIVYGIIIHADGIEHLWPHSVQAWNNLSQQSGLLFVVALFIRAYGMGGGTYTGIEAVSNSVNMLKEPRVRTGKLTMLYMATSLAFTAGGIILLYLLWHAHPVPGKTLNAVVFGSILQDWQIGGWDVGHAFLIITLILEAGLLFAAANTGFLGGPATLANMAIDHWMPHRFAQLSDRLVTKNGIVLMGIAAFAVIILTDGQVDLLVVLYSINVFLTFSLTLLGLAVYWWRNRSEKRWLGRFVLSCVGLCLTSAIMIVMFVEKFWEGGLAAIGVTSVLIFGCWMIHQHYHNIRLQLNELDNILTHMPAATHQELPPLTEGEPAAVFFVSSYRGVGIHTLLNSQRLFPALFKNFVFLSVGEVDTTKMRGDHAITNLKHRVDHQLQRYVHFCHTHGMAACSYSSYGTDPVECSIKLADDVMQRFPGSVFFAGTLVFREENFFTRLLHNHTAHAIQRALHLRGFPLVIMPMQVDSR